MSSFIDKVTMRAWSLALLIWPVANVASVARTGGSAPGLVGTSGVLDISDITQFLYHDKLSFISQLIKSKSRDLGKLLE